MVPLQLRLLEEKIYGPVSFTGLRTSGGSLYLPEDRLQWDLSPLQNQTSLVSAGRDNRDHVVQSPHTMDEENETQVRNILWEFTQLQSTSLLISLTGSPSTSSCHHCYNVTWLNIFLETIMHPFQFHATQVYWKPTMCPMLRVVLETLCRTLDTWAEGQVGFLGRCEWIICSVAFTDQLCSEPSLCKEQENDCCQ